MAENRGRHLRTVIAAYQEAIRASDFKANIAIVFVSIMMAPVVSFHDKYPAYLSLPVISLPFLVVILCLLICLYPRYPREGRDQFLISPRAGPDNFPLLADPEFEIEHLPVRCAILSRILYWKTFFLKISILISIVAIIFAGGLLAWQLR
jgi:hypothetical protein